MEIGELLVHESQPVMASHPPSVNLSRRRNPQRSENPRPHSPIVACRLWQCDASRLISLNSEPSLPCRPLNAGCRVSVSHHAYEANPCRKPSLDRSTFFVPTNKLYETNLDKMCLSPRERVRSQQRGRSNIGIRRTSDEFIPTIPL